MKRQTNQLQEIQEDARQTHNIKRIESPKKDSVSPVADFQPLNRRLVLVRYILSLVLALGILRPASRLLLVF